MQTFRMQLAWRSCFWMLLGLGAAALVLGTAELGGLVPRGAVLDATSDLERWVCVAVGALLVPFAALAKGHLQLTLDDRELRYLGFGPLPRTRALALSDVLRWGHAVARNQGRREPMLLFELRDRTTPSVKLAMYEGQAEILRGLTERLGPPAPAVATVAGLRFEE